MDDAEDYLLHRIGIKLAATAEYWHELGMNPTDDAAEFGEYVWTTAETEIAAENAVSEGNAPAALVDLAEADGVAFRAGGGPFKRPR